MKWCYYQEILVDIYNESLMGVPTSEVGYTSAMPRKSTSTCGGIGGDIYIYIYNESNND